MTSQTPTTDEQIAQKPEIDESVPKRSRKTAVIIGGKTVYLNNRELLNELKIANAAGRMTDKLAAMLKLICARYARKGNFVNYSYNDDMQSYAMLMLVKTWKSFNADKGSNPFAFFTQCIKNSFRQYLKYERKHRDIRDAELINQGLSPSYGYESGIKDVDLFDDEQDWHSTYEIDRPDPLADDVIDVTKDITIVDEPIPMIEGTDPTDSTEESDELPV